MVVAAVGLPLKYLSCLRRLAGSRSRLDRSRRIRQAKWLLAQVPAGALPAAAAAIAASAGVALHWQQELRIAESGVILLLVN